MTAPSVMPTWAGFMIPVLRVQQDGATRQVRVLQELVADEVGLTQEQRADMLDSGQPRFRNRIGAVSFLTRAGALVRPKRGVYTITDLGRELMASHTGDLTENDLKQVPGWAEYTPATRGRGGGGAAVEQTTGSDQHETVLDPFEQIDSGVRRVHADVAAQLLDRLRAADPDFLEQSVLDVLVAMGYGGVEQRARRIGGSGDGGVDGVIDQDPLGLARIYVQAKRYAADNVVGRPQVEGFVGALHGQQANQGVFITTSGFSRDAVDYARTVNASVVLIDGVRLATLMITHGVGVRAVETYTVVELDELLRMTTQARACSMSFVQGVPA